MDRQTVTSRVWMTTGIGVDFIYDDDDDKISSLAVKQMNVNIVHIGVAKN